MKKLNGFTLAEVLITLAIIGVVAALTVPSVMQDTTGQRYKVALKKGVSTLNQAVLRSVAMDKGDFNDNTVNSIITTNLRGVEANTATTACGSSGYTLADGMVVVDKGNSQICIDVNGAGGPNTMTTDSTKPKDGYTLKYSDDIVSCNDTICKNILRDK